MGTRNGLTWSRIGTSCGLL